MRGLLAAWLLGLAAILSSAPTTAAAPAAAGPARGTRDAGLRRARAARPRLPRPPSQASPAGRSTPISSRSNCEKPVRPEPFLASAAGEGRVHGGRRRGTALIVRKEGTSNVEVWPASASAGNSSAAAAGAPRWSWPWRRRSRRSARRRARRDFRAARFLRCPARLFYAQRGAARRVARKYFSSPPEWLQRRHPLRRLSLVDDHRRVRRAHGDGDHVAAHLVRAVGSAADLLLRPVLESGALRGVLLGAGIRLAVVVVGAAASAAQLECTRRNQRCRGGLPLRARDRGPEALLAARVYDVRMVRGGRSSCSRPRTC